MDPASQLLEMMPCTHTRMYEKFITLIMELSGDSRAAPKLVQNWLE